METAALQDLLAVLKPFQASALNVDIVWVYGPTTPLPGTWDAKIAYPRTENDALTAMQVTRHGGGFTPNEALAAAVAVAIDAEAKRRSRKVPDDV